MTTLLLLALPWGYLIAAAFLLLAIILFVVAIFMKDTGNQEEIEHSYTQEQENTYESDFDRYPAMTTEVDSETKADLKEMIAEPAEDLGETKMFTPVMDIPEPEPFEEPEEEPVEEVFEEPVEEPAEEEALFESPVVGGFEDPVEPEEEPVEEIPEETNHHNQDILSTVRQ